MRIPALVLGFLVASVAAFTGCGDDAARPLAQNKELTSFGFLTANNPQLTENVTATISGNAINATVPFGTNVTGLVATFVSTGTSVTVGATRQNSGGTANNFAGPQTYRVTAADSSTRDYTVTVRVAPSSAKELTAYAFHAAANAGLGADVTATINGTAVAATVPFGTDVTALVATFSTTGASVSVGSTAQVSGTTANSFTGPVTYRVTAADGTTRDYVVTVSIAPSNAKEITAYSFLSANNGGLTADVTATLNAQAIAATVPFGTNVGALVATFSTNAGASVKVGATPQVSGITANNFAAPVTYTVVAADGSTKDFIVTVTVAANAAKEITAYAFLSTANPGVLTTDVIATFNGTAIAATVPFGTNVGALVATFSTTGVSVKVGDTVQDSGVTANNFAAPVIYTVVAADGSTKDFIVTVTVAANSAKEITTYAFLSTTNQGALNVDVTATISGTSIAATVPFGTNVSALIATFATTGVSVKVGDTVQVSGTTANDFSAPVVYTVTAADGSPQDFTVTVTIAPSPEKDITAFSFRAANNAGMTGDVTATITGTAITATLPFGANLASLIATFTVSAGATVTVGATTQISGTTANDFTSPVTYTVTAANTTSQAFTVTITPTCEALPDPANGTVTVSNGGVFPSTATYTCNAGFAPLGATTRTCAINGLYSGVAPTCNAASIMVVHVGDGAAALSNASTAVSVEQRSVTDGAVVQTIPLPTVGTPVTMAGNATSEGGLSRSVDGRFVTLAGFAAAPGVAAIAGTPNVTPPTATNRVVARINAAGVVDASTLLLNAFSASDVRAATTVDGSGFWVSGTSSGSTGGVHFVQLGSTGATTRVLATPDNARWTHVIDGQLYASSASGAFAGVLSVGIGTPTEVGAVATRFASPANAYGFALFDRSPVVVGPDTLYVAIDALPGTDHVNVQRWTFDGVAWAQDATFTPTLTGVNLGARGLAAWEDALGVHVVVTTNEANANRIVSFLDDGSTASPAVTTLATAAMNTVFRGVALSPVP